MSIGVAGEQSCASCLLAASGLTYNKKEVTFTESGCQSHGKPWLRGNSDITDFVNMCAGWVD